MTDQERQKGRRSRTEAPTDQERLTALRSRLEGALNDPTTTPRDLAALSREYRQLLAQLASSALPVAGSALDEIAARRVRRGAS